MLDEPTTYGELNEALAAAGMAGASLSDDGRTISAHGLHWGGSPLAEAAEFGAQARALVDYLRSQGRNIRGDHGVARVWNIGDRDHGIGVPWTYEDVDSELLQRITGVAAAARAETRRQHGLPDRPAPYRLPGVTRSEEAAPVPRVEQTEVAGQRVTVNRAAPTQTLPTRIYYLTHFPEQGVERLDPRLRGSGIATGSERRMLGQIEVPATAATYYYIGNEWREPVVLGPGRARADFLAELALYDLAKDPLGIISLIGLIGLIGLIRPVAAQRSLASA